MLAAAGAAAVAVPCAVVYAQDISGSSSGAPRNIVPAGQLQPDTPTETPSPSPRRPRPSGASPVQIGELGALEGPIAGTLDNSNGGLGLGEWQGSDRTTMGTMLQSVPAATSSATHRLLMRKLLLTGAPPPPGRSSGSFNQVRLSKLLDGAYLDDAAQLALKIQEPRNFDVVRAQADAFLYAGRDDDACSDITSHRLDSAEPFWVELRVYCYAVTNDTGPLDLTRAVITEQGIADPAFVTLLDGWTSGKPVMPDAIRFPDSIHIAMLARLKLPMTAEIATNVGLPGSLITASSMATPAAIRMAAAEKALRAGVLPKDVLEQILDLSKFGAQELDGAPAMARAEPLMKGLARLRSAVKVSGSAESRAELVHTAFEVAQREGVLRQVAELFAAPAADLMPDPEWSRWSDLMVRGLLLAGRSEAAQRWLDVVDPSIPGNTAEVQQLNLAFALAAPNPRRNAEAKRVLTEIAHAVDPSLGKAPTPPDTDPAMTDHPADMPVAAMPLEKPAPELLARATLDLGITEAAAGDLVPADAKSSVEPLLKDSHPGRHPAAVLMQRIDKAALSDARGEVALAVATALGDRGPGDLAPDAVVRLIRALQTASMRDAAHLLAQEALLLRPGAGAARP